jgi:hypothetical protein
MNNEISYTSKVVLKKVKNNKVISKKITHNTATIDFLKFLANCTVGNFNPNLYPRYLIVVEELLTDNSVSVRNLTSLIPLTASQVLEDVEDDEKFAQAYFTAVIKKSNVITSGTNGNKKMYLVGGDTNNTVLCKVDFPTDADLPNQQIVNLIVTWYLNFKNGKNGTSKT